MNGTEVVTSHGVPRKRCGYTAPTLERIKFHTVVDGSGCWIWRGATNSSGYGRITVRRERFFTHRLAYSLLRGPIPEGWVIDHLCRVPLCCNPAHLEAVPERVNIARGMSPQAVRRRRGTCDFGHAYPDGPEKQCRECRLAYMRLWRRMPAEQRAARKAAGLPVVDMAAHFLGEVAA